MRMNNPFMNINDIKFLLKDKYNFQNPNLADILRDIKLLESGYPLAYIIGYVDFLNCKINVNHKTLIPRPETEYWVNNLKIENVEKSGLDIFCGSGCIGISLLKKCPKLNITFADVDDNALKQTKENLDINKIDKSRYEVIKSDLFENINEKFDYIFANPPYVSKGDKVGKETKYEPKIALYSKNNGLEIINKFLNTTEKYLNQNGTLYMEFGNKQKGEIEKILNEMMNEKTNKEMNKEVNKKVLRRRFHRRRTFSKDQFNRWRLVSLQAF